MSSIATRLSPSEEKTIQAAAKQTRLAIEKWLKNDRQIDFLHLVDISQDIGKSSVDPAKEGTSIQNPYLSENKIYTFLDIVDLDQAIVYSQTEVNSAQARSEQQSNGMSSEPSPENGHVLAVEIALYDALHADLLELFEDQYVLIKHVHLIGVFPEQYEALMFGYKHLGNVPFLLRQITQEEKVVFA